MQDLRRRVKGVNMCWVRGEDLGGETGWLLSELILRLGFRVCTYLMGVFEKRVWGLGLRVEG